MYEVILALIYGIVCIVAVGLHKWYLNRQYEKLLAEWRREADKYMLECQEALSECAMAVKEFTELINRGNKDEEEI